MRIRAQARPRSRRGSVLPLTAMCLVGLVGFVALSIDVGMMMVAQTQCQAAADSAAMAGCRTLNGDVSNNNNYSNVGANTMAAATSSTVMTHPVQSSWVNYEIGYYTYDSSASSFGMYLPSSGQTMPTGQSWSLVTASVNYSDTTYFAKIFNVNTYSLTAKATAVHRPRDVAIIVDYSGSMSFDSLLGGSYTGSRTQSLNPDTLVPTFGHYYSSTNTTGFNPVASSTYVLSSGEVLGLSNLTCDTSAGTAMVNDYYQNNVGASPVVAFTSQPASYGTTPGGDVPLKKTNNLSSAAYATTVNDVLSTTSYNSTFELNSTSSNVTTCGYSMAALNGGTAKPFNGYTMGPGYWGKTFFIWPPDPRNPVGYKPSDSGWQPGDWRKRFFSKTYNASSNASATWVNDNSLLWTSGSSPVARVPSSTSYFINYAAILRWLTTTGTNPFPTQLRAGRINYYTAIPDTSNSANDAALNARMYVANPTDTNERFWKQYIDFVLGFDQTGGSVTAPTYSDISSQIGYGADFTWGTKQITAYAPTSYPNSTSSVYMNYKDNPPRSPTRFWFGPLTMLDFLDNYNLGQRWMPGTAHQCPEWACKIGLRGAFNDIQNNHPNDYVCLTYFSVPQYSLNDGGRFNQVRVPLGRSYQSMIDSLFYPPSTISSLGGTQTEINVYDSANMLEVPRSTGGTCTVMSLMHAYNQFSSNTSLQTFNPSPAPTGQAGGLGRVGAQKVIILETDGVPNSQANATFVNNGANQSYFKIRNGEYPTNSLGSYSSVNNQIYGVCQNICNLTTAGTPGYSTTRKPALIHTIAFGTMFDPVAAPGATTSRNAALAVLQQIQTIGNVQSSASTPLDSSKIIIGNSATRIANIQTAFQKIMQGTVSVTLIQ